MIECSCDCDYYDFEPIKCSTHKVRKAGKDHVCEECGEPILKGTKYHYFGGLFQYGGSYQYRVCCTCWAIGHDHFCGCYPWGGLWEALGELYDHDTAVL